MSTKREMDEAAEREPTARELAAIEAEWPSIARGIADVDAEIRSLTDSGHLDQLDVRRARRNRRRALRAATSASLHRLGGEAA